MNRYEEIDFLPDGFVTNKVDLNRQSAGTITSLIAVDRKFLIRQDFFRPS